ncbi:MAG: FtsX-like permease family protein [Caldilineaceae bacterium]
MRALYRYFGLWRFALQRLRSELALTLSLLCGWTLVIALTAALPMYTDAVNRSQLQQELQGAELRNRPAFTFFYHFTSGTTGGAEWERYQILRDYMAQSIASDLGLPLQGGLHYAKSDILQVFPNVGGAYNIGRDQPLMRGYLGFVGGLEGHITLVDGAMPAVQTSADAAPLEVLIQQSLATETGMQVGELYLLFDPSARLPTGGRKRLEVPVRIAGIWTPKADDPDFWSMSPTAFANVFLIPEATYVNAVRNLVPYAFTDLGWYRVFNGDSVRAEDVDRLLARVTEVSNRVFQRLPNTYLEFSPVAALTRYQRAASAQAILLLLFGIPILGLILYFIVLIAESAVNRQQTEIAIFKSRGASSSQVLLIYLLQSITLGALALVLGPWLARLIAGAIGSTYHFLAFRSGPALQVAITDRSLRYALVALFLAMFATLLPALEAARLTIVAAKRESGRRQRNPFWQRAFLDILLLVVALYGFYLLKTQGRIAFLQGGAATDPLENPLLFLAPALFIFAGALFCVRLFPLVIRLLSWSWARVGGVAVLLALYNVGRSSQAYANLLLLLILTTSLGAFTASMARTLDENLVARSFYQIGADLALTEGVGVVPVAENGTDNTPAPDTVSVTAASDPTNAIWVNMPVADHVRAAGVKAATRIGQFEVSTAVASQLVEGTLYGIDRADFPSVAYFRADFAASSLGALMNALAVRYNGVIVSRTFLEQSRLNVGDILVLRGLIPTSNQGVTFQIVGTTELFPTAYPQNGDFFVANLDYIFEALGQELPYTVWLATDEGVDVTALTAELDEIGYRVLGVQDARALISKAQRRPERIGLFGFLSVGFVATTGLSMLALIIYAVLSFRQRFVQLGILRAVGLSSRQLALSLGSEQILVTATGIAIGSYLGLLSSYLFIPFLQVGYNPADLFPPFVVLIAWDDVSIIVMVLAAMLLVATLSVIWLLMRMKMFQAVKLGEAV